MGLTGQIGRPHTLFDSLLKFPGAVQAFASKRVPKGVGRFQRSFRTPALAEQY
jgi:hypothetical protein